MCSLVYVGAIPISRAFFGQGTGRIYLDELNCDRSEVRLEYCGNDGVKVHNCGHAEDAGVICIGVCCVCVRVSMHVCV